MPAGDLISCPVAPAIRSRQIGGVLRRVGDVDGLVIDRPSDRVFEDDARKACTIFKGVSSDGRDVAPDGNSRELFAVGEDARADRCDGIGDKDALQSGAAGEGALADGSEPVGQRDGGKLRAVINCEGTDGGEPRGDDGLRHGGATRKDAFADRADAVGDGDARQ